MKVICIFCGLAALAMSALFLVTQNMMALFGLVGFFLAFRVAYQKYMDEN